MMENRKVSELKYWEKNPRDIKPEDYEKLKRQIADLNGGKPFKPLLINQDNIVLGGNMRLKAFRDMGIDEVEVSIVQTNSEGEMVKYALADNDSAGYTVKEKLQYLVAGLDINLEDYGVHLKPAELLSDILDGQEEKVKGKVEFTEELLEEHNYIVLYFDNSIDWLNLQSLFPLKTVKALDSKKGYEKQGVGRVIKGVDFLNAIRKQN